MRYRIQDAKTYSRAHLKGIWAAASQPFTPDFVLDEAGFRRNLRHWVDDLSIDGVVVSAKQGECFAMSVPERKRVFEMAVDEIGDRAGTIMSCSDQNMDVTIDLARHAKSIGADYIAVQAPVLHFVRARDEAVYNYFKYMSENVDIGIALVSHPDSGYLMSPELCARIADLPNVVAIDYSAPRKMYTRLTELAGDKMLVSTGSEEKWLDNIAELNWQLHLCTTAPYLLQTKFDKRMRDFTDLAFGGKIEEARNVRKGLSRVRRAFRQSRPADKPQAHSKYWQELLGQAGGAVRPPLLALTDAEKAATRSAFESCGLRLEGTQAEPVRIAPKSGEWIAARS